MSTPVNALNPAHEFLQLISFVRRHISTHFRKVQDAHALKRSGGAHGT